MDPTRFGFEDEHDVVPVYSSRPNQLDGTSVEGGVAEQVVLCETPFTVEQAALVHVPNVLDEICPMTEPEQVVPLLYVVIAHSWAQTEVTHKTRRMAII